jgi:hypothetical protein
MKPRQEAGEKMASLWKIKIHYQEKIAQMLGIKNDKCLHNHSLVHLRM